MTPENSPLFKSLVRAIRLLAAMGAIAMASTREPEPMFLLIFLSFFLIGLKVEEFPRLAAILGKLQPVLALGFFGVALVDFFFLSKSFLLTVAHFLLAIQGLRMLTLRTLRENIGSILVSSMLILSSCTLAVDWTFFAILTLFLPLVIWALLLHTLEIGRIATTSGPEGPSADWKPLYRTLRKSCVSALLVAALCCAFVFVVFPRFNFQGFRGQFLQPVHKAGYTSQVNLDKSGRIQMDAAVIMRVEIAPEDRPQWIGYIRGATLSAFDGKTWRKSPQNLDRIYRMGVGEFLIPHPGVTGGRRLKQSFYLESMDAPILFTVSQAALVAIDRPYIERSSDGTLQRGNNDSWRVHYTVESLVQNMGQIPQASGRGWNSRRLIPPGRNGAAERAIDQTRDLAAALELPSKDFTRLKDLARSLEGGARSKFDMASHITAGLREKYGYTTDLGVLKKGEDPIERFLFETKQGHCEYFASAMCLMLRLENIPARMVTGFHSQEWNKRGNYFVVRAEDAHAWVEAYIEPYGWISFDPSPREPRVGLNGDQGNWKDAWDYLNLRWNRYILSYDLQRQVAMFRSITQQSNRFSNRLEFFMGGMQNIFNSMGLHWSLAGKKPGEVPWKQGLAALGLLTALLAVTVMALAAIRSRRKAEKVWFYRPLLRFLEKTGGRKPASETLFEFSQRLESALAGFLPDIRFLEEQYYRLRFGPSGPLSVDEENRIKAVLSRLR